MKDPKFLLTLQPRFYENAISSDEEQELDGLGDQKLGNLGGAESMMIMDESQHQLIAAGSQIQPIFEEQSFDEGHGHES